MKTAKMLGYGLPHMDRFVIAWVTLITAANDILNSFHDAWSSIRERYLPLSFWHFFFSKKMELYRVLQQVKMSGYKLKTYQMIDIDTGDDAGTT